MNNAFHRQTEEKEAFSPITVLVWALAIGLIGGTLIAIFEGAITDYFSEHWMPVIEQEWYRLKQSLFY